VPPSKTDPGPSECISCFDDIPASSAVRAPCHPYCRDCFGRLVSTAAENEAQWPPKCCLNELPAKLVLKHVSRDVAKTYTARAAEFKVPIDERLYCPAADCGVYVPRSGVSLITRAARCPAGHSTCTMCRQPAHGRGTACPRDAELQATEALAADEGWRRCLRCGVLVEHRDACQHMTCRCGGQFCYVCGAAWRTCSCSMEQLNQLKAAAAARRTARAAREDAEARELRDALRQVEEFQREENRKARLLAAEAERRRREAARLERWRRRLARAERVRAEKARRDAVQGKYQTWATELDGVRVFQHSTLTAAHDEAATTLATSSADEAVALAARHVRDRDAGQAEAAARLAAHEAAWERDYAARCAREAALETAYEAKLATLWTRRADGPARRAAALRAYRARNDERLDTYAAARATAAAALAWAAEEDAEVREELRVREAALRAGWATGRAAALARQRGAEAAWFDVVFAERTRLLAEMEEVERVGGGDGGLDLDAVQSSDDAEDEDEVYEDAPEGPGPSDWPLRRGRAVADPAGS